MGRTWIEFLICLAIILLAGSRLSRYGDVIAEKTGLGRTWIGVILLATVTSLPELFSGFGAVWFENAPDLAMGGLMGSCVFNLALIVLLDYIHRSESIYTRAGQGHILSASFGLILIGFVGFNLLVASTGHEPHVGAVGLWSPLLIILYAIAAYVLFQHEKRTSGDGPEPELRYSKMTLMQAVVPFTLASAVVVGTAIYLPNVCGKIATHMGWNESFVGTILMALTTSAPELVVTVAAVRMGALDLAIGNVLGSNLFNMAVLGVLDPFYRPGPMLSDVSIFHAATAFSAIMMSSLVCVGFFYRPKGRVLQTVGWVSIVLAILFFVNSAVLYLAE